MTAAITMCEMWQLGPCPVKLVDVNGLQLTASPAYARCHAFPSAALHFLVAHQLPKTLRTSTVTCAPLALSM